MGRVRVVRLELDDKKFSVVEKLMKEFGIHHNKETLNLAYRILEWCLKEIKNGRIVEITSMDEKKEGVKILDIPIFDRSKKQV